MAKAFRPDPEESPARVPPNRRPPTAIGVATPPPPPRPGVPVGHHLSILARINSALLGVALLGGSVALFALSPTTIPIGVLAVWGGAEALSISATGRGIRSRWRARHRARRRSTGREPRRRDSRAA